MTLDPDALTWTALLGRWMDYARAALAIPTDAHGDRWRETVPAVITLQAVTFALAEIDALEPAERGFARDRASVLVDRSVADLERVWGDVPLPASLADVRADARRALDAARWAGGHELVWDGPDDLGVMPEVPVGDAAGTLLVMQPGSLVVPGEPVAWWGDRDGTPISRSLPAARVRFPPAPRQVYRQFDEAGRIRRDVILPITAEPVEGMPLLVPLFDEGAPVGHFTMDAAAWEARQRAALTPAGIRVHEPS